VIILDYAADSLIGMVCCEVGRRCTVIERKTTQNRPVGNLASLDSISKMEASSCVFSWWPTGFNVGRVSCTLLYHRWSDCVKGFWSQLRRNF